MKHTLHRTTDHIDTLKEYMNDAPAIFPQIEKIVEPNQRNMIGLFKLYHKSICDSTVCIKGEKRIKPHSFYIQPEGGIQYSWSEGGESAFTYKKGVNVSFDILRSNERFYLKTGLLHESYINAENNPEYSYIVPILLEYRYPEKKIQPYFSGGLNISVPDFASIINLSGGIYFRCSKSVYFYLAPEIDVLPYLLFDIKYFIGEMNAGLRIKIK